MSLFEPEEYSNLIGFPTDELLSLPSLLLEDLEQGVDFATNLAGGRLPQRRSVIHIPAWDDVLHITPESWLPEEEQLARRRRRAINISESPVPESVQAIGTIMTWVDDVQDALLTAAVLARLGAVFYKPLLPVATGLGAAAEAFNAFNLSAQLTAAPLTGKFRTTAVLPRLLGTQIIRGLSNRALQRAIPTVGETLQILQTTQQFFGVGLSLGPLVGFIAETIFGLPQGAEFAFASGIRYPPNDQVWLRPEYQEKAQALQLHRHLHSILRGAGAAAWLLGTEHGPTFSDRVDALALLNITADLAKGFLTEARWQDLVLPSLNRPRPASRQIKPRTSLEILRLGIDPTQRERFPTPGRDVAMSIDQQARTLLTCGPACVTRWLAEAPSKTTRLFAEQLATDLAPKMVRAFEGPGTGFQTHGTPDWRAVIDSLELGLRPRQDSRPEITQAYLAEAAALYLQDPTMPIPDRQLRALHAKHYPPR